LPWQIDPFAERIGFAVAASACQMLLHTGLRSQEDNFERRKAPSC
jgi:hypothetical protein